MSGSTQFRDFIGAAGAIRIREALARLYPDSIPVRGEIEVTVFGVPDWAMMLCPVRGRRGAGWLSASGDAFPGGAARVLPRQWRLKRGSRLVLAFCLLLIAACRVCLTRVTIVSATASARFDA